ncbi:DUF1896 domain-containing protein [Elizabethkingia anophelis]|uniref:DUF1896 domain-containing protein n=1 Tax=Elizabethkingia anophelis TaxID=1117645 RepID=UPI001370009D|nr:DUF1896 domain-containing protein [Elizabethkingia anophelis]MYY43983.1 DUF1896 domain-containing protein [Elizabethkingia anophelis]
MKKPKDLSYFRIRLQEHLNLSFPEKAEDNQFITERSFRACQTYEEAFKTGHDVRQCTLSANNILFEGLYFSKFDTLFQVICNEFSTIMTDEELRPFAFKMLSVCEPVFAHYELSDDFAYSTDFDLLYTELTGAVTLWIEENGLQ